MANNNNNNVIMVELKLPIDGVPDITFFSNQKAIFEYFGDVIGIKYQSLRNYNLNKQIYENNICRILKGPVWTNKSPEVIERMRQENREALPSQGSFKHENEKGEEK